MSKAVKDYVKFNVLGIQEDLVSPEDKEKLKSLYRKKNIYEKAFLEEGKSFIIETYSIDSQLRIFNELKKRQGERARITFVSSLGFPVEIVRAEKKNGEVLLTCVLRHSGRYFKMWLDTFIQEIYLGNISKVKPVIFYDIYFGSIYAETRKIRDEIKEIEQKYNKIYKERQVTLEADYNAELAKYDKVTQEAKSNRYQMTDEQALEKARTYKGIERTKTYWNTQISEEEKNILLKWIAENIYSIRVYGLLGGQSGNALLNEYADAGNIKYRSVKKNEEGQVTSQDSIVAHISFKSLEGVPFEILNKVISTKGRNEGIFRKNRLNDKNLALFLLSEYHDKGFKAGVRNLYKSIVLE